MTRFPTFRRGQSWSQVSHDELNNMSRVCEAVANASAAYPLNLALNGKQLRLSLRDSGKFIPPVAGVTLEYFAIEQEFGDYVQVTAVDGRTEWLAKPAELRRSEWDVDTWGPIDGVSYTPIAGTTDRSASDGEVTERQFIHPKYLPGRLILGVSPVLGMSVTRLGPGGETDAIDVTWLEIGTDRSWRKVGCSD